MMPQPQPGVPLSGPVQQPMFHPAMYGQMPMSMPPMTMAPSAAGQMPFQPYMTSGQFPSMPSTAPATQPGSLPPGMVPGSMPMSMGHLPLQQPTTTADPNLGYHQPQSVPAPGSTSGAPFNLQGLGETLPPFPGSPSLQHQPMGLPHHMQQQQHQQAGGLGMSPQQPPQQQQQQHQPPPQPVSSSAFDELISFD